MNAFYSKQFLRFIRIISILFIAILLLYFSITNSIGDSNPVFPVILMELAVLLLWSSESEPQQAVAAASRINKKNNFFIKKPHAAKHKVL